MYLTPAFRGLLAGIGCDDATTVQTRTAADHRGGRGADEDGTRAGGDGWASMTWS
jgi:hypothetical protein